MVVGSCDVHGRTVLARAGLCVPVITAILAVFVLTACDMIGGGLSEEDQQALQDELDATKAELESADTLASQERVRVAQLEAEVASLQQQVEQAKTQAVAVEGQISLEKARLQVVMYAQENTEVYGPIYGSVHLVWEVASAVEDEEYYYIKLKYWSFGHFEGTPGEEEFIVDNTRKIEFRQVLSEPNPEERPQATQEENTEG